MNVMINSPGLEINNLKLHRGQWRRSYSLTLNAGERLAIQGQSGLGKTSLLMAIAGLTPCVSGSIRWQGQEIENLPAEQRPVAMLFQDDNLFEHLSVRQNLWLGINTQEISDKQMNEAVEALNLKDEIDKKPPQLSGGQRQRVGLIRTLLRPEPIVLLDEPFAELDRDTRKLASNWVKAQLYQSHKTLLMVTHQQEDADTLSTQQLQLD